MKSQGKPGTVRGFSLIFIQFREKSGKTNYLVKIPFSLAIGMAVCKVIALIVVSNCELYHLALQNIKLMCITYLLGSIFLTSFCKYVKRGQGKSWCF